MLSSPSTWTDLYGRPTELTRPSSAVAATDRTTHPFGSGAAPLPPGMPAYSYPDRTGQVRREPYPSFYPPDSMASGPPWQADERNATGPVQAEAAAAAVTHARASALASNMMDSRAPCSYSYASQPVRVFPRPPPAPPPPPFPDASFGATTPFAHALANLPVPPPYVNASDPAVCSRPVDESRRSSCPYASYDDRQDQRTPWDAQRGNAPLREEDQRVEGRPMLPRSSGENISYCAGEYPRGGGYTVQHQQCGHYRGEWQGTEVPSDSTDRTSAYYPTAAASGYASGGRENGDGAAHHHNRSWPPILLQPREEELERRSAAPHDFQTPLPINKMTHTGGHQLRRQLQEELSPTPPTSISDGARHLNLIPHRSVVVGCGFLQSGNGPPSWRGGRGRFSSAVSGDGGDGRRKSDLYASTVETSLWPHPDLLSSTHDWSDSRSSATPYRPHLHPGLRSASMRSNAMTVSSASAMQAEPCCVAALIFNNAKEVGVALCELPSLTISLFQFGDTAAYFKTTSLLHARNPVEVLVPSTATEEELVQLLLRQHGGHMTFTSVQRCFFQSEAGVQRLSQLKSTQEAALCIEDTDRYLCLAAANALVLYMEHVNDMQLLPGSVRVRAEALEHFVELSRTTARALQVITDGATFSAGSVGGGDAVAEGIRAFPGSFLSDGPAPPLAQRSRDAQFQQTCGTEPSPLRPLALVDVIPRTCTIMGQRYLRRTLLQPLRDCVAVQGRHDALEWLLHDPRRLHGLRALLRSTSLLDLERLTATLTHQPRAGRTTAQAQSFLESLLLLWSALPCLERLQNQLSSYLGPPPPSSSSGRTEGGEEVGEMEEDRCHGADHRGECARDEAKLLEKRCTVKESTPEYPAVLHSVAQTLQQCRFPELVRLMDDFLDRSILPSVVEQYAAQHRQQQRRASGNAGASLCGVAAAGSSTSVRSLQGRQRPRRQLQQQRPNDRAASALLRVLRMCFLVQAAPGGELDALRTRLSQRVADVTDYLEDVRQRFQLYSLRLEPDPVKLYCFSYLTSESAKAAALPVTWRYAGGSHFALYLEALHEEQVERAKHGDDSEQQGRRHGYKEPMTTEARNLSGGCGVACQLFGGPTSSLTSTLTTPQPAHRPAQDLSAASSCANNTPWSMMQGRVSGGAGATSRAANGYLPSAAASAGLFSANPVEDSSTAASNGHDTTGRSPATNCRSRRSRVRCGTEELEYRCDRTQECVAAILAQQLQAVGPLQEALRREHLGALQATVEAVALLDTLLSFALYSLTHRCTRPVLVDTQTGQTTTPAAAMEKERAATSADGECCGLENVCDVDNDSTAVISSVCSSLLHACSLTTPTARARHREPSYRSVSVSEAESALTEATAPRPGTPCAIFLRGAYHPSSTAGPRLLAMPEETAQSRFCSHRGMGATCDEEEYSGGGLSISWGAEGDVCVVTGPNACGKTTLLRVIGQHFILAQAGCFIPARQAQLFLADRLLANMLCDELPSVTHSSFKRELMELNELTHAATSQSVVLIDELGRSTTTAQGFSLAWAAAVTLSERRVHGVLTSHFAGLPILTRARPGRVLAYHYRMSYSTDLRENATASTEEERESGNSDGAIRRRHLEGRTVGAAARGSGVTRVSFGHELFPGPCPQRWYGLAMAEQMAFFSPVLELAQAVRVAQGEAAEGSASPSASVDDAR